MPATPLDSHLYRDLLHDPETAQLFSDSAEVRAMMIVEGALAKVQGQLGLIPEVSGAFLHRASMEIQIDPSGLAAETGRSAVPVPALVKAMRTALEAPEHAQHLHFGATSQDIMDTALMLRLRQFAAIQSERIAVILSQLAELAERYAKTPMAGRTYGQVATPSSFGALVASWGKPLLRLRADLERLRPDFCVSLSGAAGTLSAMGPKGPEVRAALADALGLADPGGSWHAERDRITALAGCFTQITATLGKIGEDLSRLAQSEIAEVTLGQSGASSTMPQKQNPVQPQVLVALAQMATTVNAAVQGAAVHGLQRDGAAWITEWLSLPQLCMLTGQATRVAVALTKTVAPREAAMRTNIDDGRGLIYAEALSFTLARTLPRPEAQEAVKTLCAQVLETGTPLRELAAQTWPDHNFDDLFTPEAQLGEAPAQARAFAQAVRNT